MNQVVLHPSPPVSPFSPVVFSSFFPACPQTCLLSACLPGSQQVWGLYLITSRLNSLRQWWLIWRGGPGLFLFPDPVPNTITLLFRYPAVFYNFAIFQCQGQAFWRVFIEFPDGPCRPGPHFFSVESSPALHFLHFFFFLFRDGKKKKKIRARFHQVLKTVFHRYYGERNKLKTQQAENPLHFHY